VLYCFLSNFDREMDLKKVEEVKRQSEEISKAIQMGIAELDALQTKLTESREEHGRLRGKFFQRSRQAQLLSTVDDIEELETLELVAKNEEEDELKAALDGKLEELKELTEAQSSLLMTADQYFLPN
jgi:hypothetical protein